MSQVNQQSRSTDQVCGIRNVGWRFHIHLRLLSSGPAFIGDEALFQLTHTGQVIVKFVASVGSPVGSQQVRLITHVIKDEAAVFRTTHLGLKFVGTTFQEQVREHSRRRRGCRNERAGSCPRQPRSFAWRQPESVTPTDAANTCSSARRSPRPERPNWFTHCSGVRHMSGTDASKTCECLLSNLVWNHDECGTWAIHEPETRP